MLNIRTNGQRGLVRFDYLSDLNHKREGHQLGIQVERTAPLRDRRGEWDTLASFITE